MTLEWSISLGNLITATLTMIGFVGGAFAFVYAIRSSADLMHERLVTLGGRMINVENDIKALSKVITEMAVQDQRITNQAARIDDMARTANDWQKWTREQIDDLRSRK